MTEPRQLDSEAERIGQAILDLSARLPDGFHGLARDGVQADLHISYDAGDEIWSVEFDALDPGRYRIVQDRSLDAAVTRLLELDREVAPDV